MLLNIKPTFLKYTKAINKAGEKQIVLHPNVYLEQGRKYYNENLPQARVSTSTVENTHVFKDNTTYYGSALSLLEDMIKTTQIGHDPDGYDIVKKPKKKLNKKRMRNQEQKRSQGYRGGMREL
ncbi:MAG: hypothetical protein ACYDCN_16060 [Bacteroidia bacterium]